MRTHAVQARRTLINQTRRTFGAAAPGTLVLQM